MEEDAEQAGGERHLTLERRLHGGQHDALQLLVSAVPPLLLAIAIVGAVLWVWTVE